MGVNVRGSGCGLGFFGAFVLGLEEMVGPGSGISVRRWGVVGGVVAKVIPVCDASSIATYFLFDVGDQCEVDEAMIAA